ncbi:MAG: hypothetical protein WD576_05275 [Nitriliruptoraceae bacterium]
MLPDVSSAQPEAVHAELQVARTEATRCLRATVGDPAVETVMCVVVCDIAQPRLATTDQLTLAPLGYPHVVSDVAPASMPVVARRLGLPVDHGRVDGPAAVMGLQVRVHTTAACGFLLLPREPNVVELDLFANQLAQVVRESDQLAIVAGGDLSAALTERSPGYTVPGAGEFDRQVVAALAENNAPALLRELADSALTFMAYGWSSLYLMSRLADACALDPVTIHYSAPCGVGQVAVAYG